MFDQLKFRYRAWRYASLLDRAEIECINRQLQAGQLAVDVGAHKGGYLYWLRKGVGRTGRVVAFEPQPVLSAYLSSIVRKMGYGNVVIENKGVSSESGFFDLYIPDNGKLSSPGARLDAGTEEDNTFRKVQIETVALDSYFQERKKKIALLKIDVEGHELEVFRGAEIILGEDRPLLLFECEQRHHQDLDIAEIFAFLKERGYEGSFIYRGQRLPIEQFSVEQHQTSKHFKDADYCNNFVFQAV